MSNAVAKGLLFYTSRVWSYRALKRRFGIITWLAQTSHGSSLKASWVALTL